MALISGRPISFQMNLYDALFIKRPVVEPELFASLRPPTYSGALGLPSNQPETPGPSRTPAPAEGPAAEDLAPKQDKDGQAKGNGKNSRGYFGREVQKELNETMQLGRSVASAATAEKLGDYFQYAVDHAVSLPRQKSALLPIVTKDVDGDRVSIYNESTHAKFPLLGLVFKNT